MPVIPTARQLSVAAKEAHVSGLAGGPAWEVAAITLLPPSLLWTSEAILRMFGGWLAGGKPPGPSGELARLAFDLAAVALPLLIVLTTEGMVAGKVLAACTAASVLADLCVPGCSSWIGKSRGRGGAQRSAEPGRAGLCGGFNDLERDKAGAAPPPLSPEVSGLIRAHGPTRRGAAAAGGCEGGEAEPGGVGRLEPRPGSEGPSASEAETETAGGREPAPPTPSCLPIPVSSAVLASFSDHKGALQLATALCILAVDFRSFPRRFAKTAAHGLSVMDAGVGAVVATGGIARGLALDAGHGGGHVDGGRGRRGRGTRGPLSFALRLLPLILLGVGRTVVLRLIGYQLVAGEYGEHWNFFLTLAVISLADRALGPTICPPPSPPIPRRAGARSPASRPPVAAAALLAAVATLALHALSLGLGGLADAVQSPERGPGLLSRNLEGIASLPGFVGLHFLSFAVGAWVALGNARQAGGAPEGCFASGPSVRLASAALAATLAALALPFLVGPPSRRLADPAYCLTALALTLASWLGFLLVELGRERRMGSGHDASGVRAPSPLTPASPLPWAGRSLVPSPAATAADIPRSDTRSPLFSVPARNALPFFLSANLATGAINCATDTLSLDPWAARVLVGTYVSVLCLLFHFVP